MSRSFIGAISQRHENADDELQKDVYERLSSTFENLVNSRRKYIKKIAQSVTVHVGDLYLSCSYCRLYILCVNVQ